MTKSLGTVANINSNGKTNMSGVFKAIFLLIVLVGLGPLLKDVPKPWGKHYLDHLDQIHGGNGSLTSDEEDQIKINTWNQMISDTIYFFEFDKIGLDVSAS